MCLFPSPLILFPVGEGGDLLLVGKYGDRAPLGKSGVDGWLDCSKCLDPRRSVLSTGSVVNIDVPDGCVREE